MGRFIQCTGVLLVLAGMAWADDWKVRGRVIDESGKPVADATVSHFWSGNGTGKRADGSPLDLKKEDDVRAYWSHVGQMEPRNPETSGKTGSDGSFRLKFRDIFHTVLAMDRTRTWGGLAVIPKGKEDQPIEIRLGRLVRVHGTFQGPKDGRRPHWSHVYVMVPEDPTRPLDTTRLAHCGSFEARFEVALPPGKYVLEAYGNSTTDEDIDVGVAPDREIVVPGDVRELDLGVLRMTPRVSLEKRIRRSKAAGSWSDYTEHYGEPPPPWNITDARGVDKKVQISDYRGKWVLVEFWGPGCRPCLSKSLPRLMQFYDVHAAERDRFEVLALCIDLDGNLKSIADVDRAIHPIVKHVWNGKNLPFPVLLDSTFRTWERYGGPAFGTAILIDPQGNLVRGDESTLAELLKK